jgi:homoserine O-succinyltransferase
MPFLIEDPHAPRQRDGALVVALVNNMPDAALEPTESQFASLLAAAAGDRPVRLRRIWLPEVPRGEQAMQRIRGGYFPVDSLAALPPDALIVTGMEPRAPVLEQEPYWNRMVELLRWAQAHTVTSFWSCLAAHVAAQALAGVRRERLTEKCFGVFDNEILAAHPLLKGIASPVRTPHSRWNALPVAKLRAGGFEVLTASTEAGADLFVRGGKSLIVCCQGHPEYEAVTLLKEYRRDVGRYLRGEQEQWPTLPHRYFGERGSAALALYRQELQGARDPGRIGDFPMAAVAAELNATWRDAAVSLYRNWLAYIAAMRRR